MIPLIWQSPSGYVGEQSPNYYDRDNFYGVGGIPHAEFGGYISVVGGGVPMYSYYLNAYNQIVNYDSPVHIDLEFTQYDADNYLISADIEILADLTTTNNKVVFILTRFINAEYFSSVVYYADTNLTITQQGQTDSFSTVIPGSPIWAEEDLKAVVLVQPFSDYPGNQQHLIYQAAQTAFAEDPPSQIEVLHPNGGEEFVIGGNMQILWDSFGTSNYVKLALLRGEDLSMIITNAASNDGSYLWTIPGFIEAADNYRIRISDFLDQDIFDLSDDFFTMDFRPQSPESIRIEIENGMIYLSWQQVPDVAFYRIYGSEYPDTGFILLDTVYGETTWNSPVSRNERYFYVTAEN